MKLIMQLLIIFIEVSDPFFIAIPNPTGWWEEKHLNLDSESGVLPWINAFPSGHVPTTILVGSMTYVLAPVHLRINKDRKYIYLAFIISILYLFEITVALVACGGHWWSDMFFQWIVVPIWFLLAYLLWEKIVSLPLLETEKSELWKQSLIQALIRKIGIWKKEKTYELKTRNKRRWDGI